MVVIIRSGVLKGAERREHYLRKVGFSCSAMEEGREKTAKE